MSLQNNLEILGLSKIYNKTIKALDNVNLSFNSGVYGILGPNGAGKSTLFKILTGIVERDAGNILYNGKSIFKDIENFKNNFGYMPQNENLYPDLSVKQFLRYICLLKGMKDKSISDEIKRVLNLTDLMIKENEKINSLSGGMKRRLLLCTALINDPSLLFFDEPTAGLDPKQKAEVRNLISSLMENKIILISSHLTEDIENIAKEIVFIDSGRVALKDSTNKILRHYKNICFESIISKEDYHELQGKISISRVSQISNDKIYIRVYGKNIAKEVLSKYSFQAANPNLEEVYLYIFEGDNNV